MTSKTGTAAANQHQSPFNPARRSALVRAIWFAGAVAVAIIFLGALPLYYGDLVRILQFDPNIVGGHDASLQALIGLGDFGSSLISYALALLLFWRKPNDRMALLASFFFLFTAVASVRSLDYFLSTYFGAPSTYHFWSGLQTPFWILIFSVFPDGHFAPRWTRWLFLVSLPVSWATLGGSEWRAVTEILTLPLLILVSYAVVYRYRRVSSDSERKQTKWWVYGVFVGLILSLVASLIYRTIAPPLLNVTPIFLGIAILRSRLWDIDIIIRRTLIYGALTAALAFVYLASVLLLEQLFRQLTGQQQTDVVIVLSTLASAALFAPLRSRFQQGIDRRFYRRKYDAQAVLAAFGARVRDEVDLNQLNEELLTVVEQTMQPASVGLWLRESAPGRERRGP